MTGENTPDPGPDRQPARAPAPTAAGTDAPAGNTPAGNAPGPEPSSRSQRWRAQLTRRRGAFAGAAVALVAVGGLGGVALGHAVADDDGSGRQGRLSQLQPGDDHQGFTGRGARPDGAFPGQPPGTVQDGDGDLGYGTGTGTGTGTGADDATGGGTPPGSQT